MKIGENPIIEVRLPFMLNIDDVKEIIFTLQGNEKIKKIYPSTSVSYNNGCFFIGITQEDTLILARRTKTTVSVEAQINYKNKAVNKSTIDTFVLEPTLNTEIVEGNTPSNTVATLNLHYIGAHLVVNSEQQVEVTDEQIRRALPNVVTADEIGNFIETFIEEHPEHEGSSGTNGKSAYEIAVEQGYEGTEEEWLDSLKGTPGESGTNGKSTYDLAVDNGFQGTEEEWLDSLKGTPGASGTNGKSAYEIAVEQGYEGTEAEFGEALTELTEPMTNIDFTQVFGN